MSEKIERAPSPGASGVREGGAGGGVALWTRRALEAETTVRWRIGPLSLWLSRAGTEWQLALQREPDGEGRSVESAADGPPADVKWRRWVAGDGDGTAGPLPVLPDRPLILRPESPITIPGGREAVFFVSIPVWVRVEAGDPPETLCEEPTVVLSKSWFGTPTEGELCYALRTTARRSIEGMSPAVHRALSPIAIANDAATPLHFERLCLRTEYQRIYRGTDRLWTSLGRVSYRGGEQLSHVEFEADAPPMAGRAELLTDARRVVDRGGFIFRSFESLRGFSDV